MTYWSWAWAPVVAIAAAAVANGAMIAVTLRHPPDSASSARPGSGLMDAGVMARRRFSESGATLTADAMAGGLRASLSGTRIVAATVVCERPDDAALDTTVVWPPDSRSVDIPLPRAGRWTVRLLGRDASGQALETVAEMLLP